jgi:hypothetical protein
MFCRARLIEPYTRASAFEETAPAGANIPTWSRSRQPLAEVQKQAAGVVGLIAAAVSADQARGARGNRQSKSIP